jgi:UDP-N-acetylmuramate dehydrogenase
VARRNREAPAELRERVLLAPYTTLGLGGPARYFHEARTANDCRDALRYAAERQLSVFVLGGGSNVVFADEGFEGLVLRCAVRGVRWDESRDDVVVTAGAGEDWDGLVREAAARGLNGIECLSGIPGTVGGTPIQNVGAYGQEIAETLVRVACLDRRTLERVEFARDECGFAYRRSRFKEADRDRYLVLEVTFRLRRGSRPELRYPELADAVRRTTSMETLEPQDAVREVRKTVLTLRRRKSMVLDPADPHSRSVGSFFLNPVLEPEAFAGLAERWRAQGGTAPLPSFPADGRVKVPAAWLVEHAGFPRGYRRQGVGISPNHALALVNYGGTARDLLALAGAIEEEVFGKFAIRLEREPVVVRPTSPL